MFTRLSNEQREKRIEDDIRNLAKLSSLIPDTLHATQSIKTKRRKRATPNGTLVDDVVELTQNLEVNYGPSARRNIIYRDNEIVHFESNVISSFNGSCAQQNESNCSPLKPPSRKPAQPNKEHDLNEEPKGEEGTESTEDEEKEREEREELPKFETLKPFAVRNFESVVKKSKGADCFF